MVAPLIRLRADAALLPRLKLGEGSSGGSVQLPSRHRGLRPGSAVQIEFSFGALSDEIVVSGHVQRVLNEEGVEVDVIPEHKSRFEHVHGVLRGDRESVVRRHQRVACRLPVVWRRSQTVYRDFTADVSCGGLFILSDHAPRERAKIELTLTIGPDDSLELFGRVTWSGEARQGRGFAIEFQGLDRESVKRLRELVRTTGEAR